MTLGLVVLNYNDYDNTAALIELLHGYQEIDHLLIVDNGSTDDSADRIEKLCGGKVELFRCGENRGYAAGNNAGIRYLMEKYHPALIGISNPDIVFSEDFIRKLKKDFEIYPRYSVLTGLQHALDGKIPAFAFWPKLTYRRCIRKMAREILIERRIVKEDYGYIDYVMGKPGNVHKVDVVGGCLFLIRAEDFLEVGGFDEHTFLYYEEEILFQKLRRTGKIAGVDTSLDFVHQFGGSSKKIIRRADMFRISAKSLKYYADTYLNDTVMKKALFNFVYVFYRIEWELYFALKELYFVLKKLKGSH